MSTIALKLQEQLGCALCLDLLSDPHCLPCLHSFCLQCLKELAQNSGGDRNVDGTLRLRCPTCRTLFSIDGGGVESLPADFLRKNLIEVIEQNEDKRIFGISCDICDGDVSAQWKCKTCGIYMCLLHKMAHSKSRSSSEHKILDLENCQRLKPVNSFVVFKIHC